MENQEKYDIDHQETQLLNEQFQKMLEAQLNPNFGRIKSDENFPANLQFQRKRLVDGIIKLYTKISRVIKEDLESNRGEESAPAKKHHSNPLVIHSAIAYLDIVLSNKKFIQFPKSDYKLISLACLSISAKFNELDDIIPLCDEYIKFANLDANKSYDAKEELRNHFIKIEGTILKDFLNWDLNLITPYHFVEIYSKMGTITSEDTIKDKAVTKEVTSKIQKTIEFFCDLSAECFQMKTYLPSIIALS